MIGYQLQATSHANPNITVKGNVIYMDLEPANVVLKALQDTETHDMVWSLACVDVQLEKV